MLQVQPQREQPAQRSEVHQSRARVRSAELRPLKPGEVEKRAKCIGRAPSPGAGRPLVRSAPRKASLDRDEPGESHQSHHDSSHRRSAGKVALAALDKSEDEGAKGAGPKRLSRPVGVRAFSGRSGRQRRQSR